MRKRTGEGGGLSPGGAATSLSGLRLDGDHVLGADASADFR